MAAGLAAGERSAEHVLIRHIRSRFNGFFFLSMPPYLDDLDVDPETKQVLRVALEKTRAALGLPDNYANGIIARQLIELVRTGERNPDQMCERALNKLREHLFGN